MSLGLTMLRTTQF